MYEAKLRRVALALAASIGIANVANAATFTVNRTGDAPGSQCIPTSVSGCSLRQAITAANATVGHDDIVFNIPACGTRSINITGTLHITHPVSIRGASQPLCGSPIPGDRTSMIELHGPGTGPINGLLVHGLVLDAGSDGSDISGLAINNFNTGIGISSNNNAIFDCKLGTDATGRIARPNSIGLATNNGGNNDISENIISANSSTGLNILSSDNFIYANEIGIDSDGNPMPNGGDGISVFSASRNVIGLAPSVGNTIVNNGGVGVRIGSFSVENEIFGNKISNNGGVGVLLQGGNHGQAAPVITSASRSFEQLPTNPPRLALVLRVQGTLANVNGSSAFKVDLYSNDACDPSGAGEGQLFFKTVSVASDGSFSLSTTSPGGPILTAIARSPDGDSSQFSTCRTVSGFAPLTLN